MTIATWGLCGYWDLQGKSARRGTLITIAISSLFVAETRNWQENEEALSGKSGTDADYVSGLYHIRQLDWRLRSVRSKARGLSVQGDSSRLDADGQELPPMPLEKGVIRALSNLPVKYGGPVAPPAVILSPAPTRLMPKDRRPLIMWIVYGLQEVDSWSSGSTCKLPDENSQLGWETLEQREDCDLWLRLLCRV